MADDGDSTQRGYHLDPLAIRDLQILAKGPLERRAVERLAFGKGDVDDVELAAEIYERAEMSERARDVLELLQIDQEQLLSLGEKILQRFGEAFRRLAR